nr:hypothetical protein Iba_chr14cCG16120 [Ipomoea batatas]
MVSLMKQSCSSIRDLRSFTFLLGLESTSKGILFEVWKVTLSLDQSKLKLVPSCLKMPENTEVKTLVPAVVHYPKLH